MVLKQSHIILNKKEHDTEIHLLAFLEEDVYMNKPKPRRGGLIL